LEFTKAPYFVFESFLTTTLATRAAGEPAGLRNLSVLNVEDCGFDYNATGQLIPGFNFPCFDSDPTAFAGRSDDQA
jgi:hypothetical protein